jgi:hypothetical protein
MHLSQAALLITRLLPRETARCTRVGNNARQLGEVTPMYSVSHAGSDADRDV